MVQRFLSLRIEVVTFEVAYLVSFTITILKTVGFMKQ
jgi:hypothetical protein